MGEGRREEIGERREVEREISRRRNRRERNRRERRGNGMEKQNYATGNGGKTRKRIKRGEREELKEIRRERERGMECLGIKMEREGGRNEGTD